MAQRKKKRFVAATEVKAIARERVGAVKPRRVMEPLPKRKPKYKADFMVEYVLT